MSNASAALRRGRRAAERLMVDTCTVVRIRRDDNGDPMMNTVGGVVTPIVDTVYVGKVKVQSNEGLEQNPRAGEKTYTIQRTSLHFPVGLFVMQVGDIATIGAAFDPALTGRRYRMVQVAPFKSLATAYRVLVEEEVS